MRQFITWAAEDLGIRLRFEGEGVDEVGIVESVHLPAGGDAVQPRVAGADARALMPGDVIVRIDPRYFRPAEVETLLGDPGRARRELGWEPETTARDMCREMVAEDRQIARRHALLKANGLELPISVES